MKVVVVGCGITGATATRFFLDKGCSVHIFETRNHIGGNCFDSYLNNVMVHNYGAHIFHTNHEDVWSFINRFSVFNNYKHKVFANTSKGLISIPFNKGTDSSIINLSDEDIKQLIYIDYSEKQWGVSFKDIPKSVIGRHILKRENGDDQYFLDKYQGVPKFGYTKMFEAMIDGATVHLACDKSDWKKESSDIVIYTGKLDGYFDYCYGRLPYRSLRFNHISSDVRQCCTINECNKDNLYTRSYDNSYWLQQKIRKTVITYEYPEDHTEDNEPLYPMPFKVNPNDMLNYECMAKKEKTFFLGRLASYKYINMDDAVKQVLEEFKDN